MKKNKNTHIFSSSCDVANNNYYFLRRFYFRFRASISLVLLVISTELSPLKSMNVRLWCMTTFLDNKTSNLCNDMAFDEAIDVDDSFLGWAVLCGMRSFPHLFLRVDNKTNWKNMWNLVLDMFSWHKMCLNQQKDMILAQKCIFHVNRQTNKVNYVKFMCLVCEFGEHWTFLMHSNYLAWWLTDDKCVDNDNI